MLKELALALLLPPANLPLFVLAGLILRRRYRRWGDRITVVSAILLLLTAMPFVGGTMLVTLEHGVPFRAKPTTTPGAIVILSGDITRFGGDDPGFGPGRLTLERERAGAALFRRVQLPVLVTGGVLGRGDPPLAMVMQQSMRDDFQIPVRWVEGKSHDTWENAAYSAAILQANGIYTVYLVTHAWHMRRAMVAFHHFGIEAIPAPVQVDRYPDLVGTYVLPQVLGWQLTSYALHEWIGYVYYLLR
jgi:uncharacterized SAM-binding protein YcdF (DUF218 family)